MAAFVRLYFNNNNRGLKISLEGRGLHFKGWGQATYEVAFRGHECVSSSYSEVKWSTSFQQASACGLLIYLKRKAGHVCERARSKQLLQLAAGDVLFGQRLNRDRVDERKVENMKRTWKLNKRRNKK